MSLQLKDRVRTGCTTIGKAEIEIGLDRAGFQNWDGITDGSDVYYALVEGNAWEVGYGVKTGKEITRNLLSSSTGSFISLLGTADVFETYPAEKAVILNLDDNIFLPATNIQAKKFIGDGSELTGLDGTEANGCIYLNNQTITDNYTIPVGKNGMSAGAIDFVGTVTVPTGSAYHVIDDEKDSLWEDVGGVATYDGAIELNTTGTTQPTISLNNTDGYAGVFDAQHDAVIKAGGFEALRVLSANRQIETVADMTVNGVTVGRGNSNLSSNVAVGTNSLNSITTGFGNLAVGNEAQANNTEGLYNTSIGHEALKWNLTGVKNTAVGGGSLQVATGANNTAIGVNSGKTLTTGSSNIIIGNEANPSSPDVNGEVTIGNADITSTRLKGTVTTNGGLGVGNKTPEDYSLYNSVFAVGNGQGVGIQKENLTDNAYLYFGSGTDMAEQQLASISNKADKLVLSCGPYEAMTIDNEGNTSTIKDIKVNSVPFGSGNGGAGQGNIAIGGDALYAKTAGAYSVSVGWKTLSENIDADYNTAIGGFALNKAKSGNNTALGYSAGNSLETGGNNTVIGYNAQPSSPNVSNEVTIGNGDVTSTRLRGAVNYKAIADYVPLDSNTRIYGKAGVGAIYDSYTHTFRVGASGDAVGMTIANSSVAIPSNIALQTFCDNIVHQNLPTTATLGNIYVEPSNGRLYRSTTAFYSAQEVDGLVNAKDAIIEKLTERLEKLEARTK